MKYYELYHALVQYPDIAEDFVRHVKPPTGYAVVHDVVRKLAEDKTLSYDSVEFILDNVTIGKDTIQNYIPKQFTELIFFSDTKYERADIVASIRKINEVK